jgi:predicted glycogen debranching enzyme
VLRYDFAAGEEQFEIRASTFAQQLRLLLHRAGWSHRVDHNVIKDVYYRAEHQRGYEAVGDVWSPGFFEVKLVPGETVALIASTETWERIRGVVPEDVYACELQRRQDLLAQSHPQTRGGPAAELVLAADQFLIRPVGRAASSESDLQRRTIIAGYHWFTDWGRDTMISLEGLTLLTGRHREAREILLSFSDAARDGLIPNLFPEGARSGLYHTADATLWFFHAIDRYVEATGDRELLRLLMPKLLEIFECHLRGTHFGIGVDPDDGLLRQGAEGYQLTWMDAKVGDWVVTPRRGKAVEINALWYNALRLLQLWLSDRDGEGARRIGATADRVLESFNARFWYKDGGYLYDVVDGEAGDDTSCRPNQIISFSLRHPVLHPDRWAGVLAMVQERLLTPFGLRSLSPDHPDYKEKYFGDLRARDAAYHQGTVWAWLIGPFIDAWLRVHGDGPRARRFLNGLIEHLGDGGIGTISEVFDGEAPFRPRGCIAQAWSVAEALRCWVKTVSSCSQVEERCRSEK